MKSHFDSSPKLATEVSKTAEIVSYRPEVCRNLLVALKAFVTSFNRVLLKLKIQTKYRFYWRKQTDKILRLKQQQQQRLNVIVFHD